MKLYVACKYCRKKIYFNSPAKIRAELPYLFNLQCQQPNCHPHVGHQIYGRGEIYNRSEVKAELGISGLVGGALVTGILGGLVAGPIGLLLGGALGGGVGSASDQTDREAVERFNAS
ncbi:hypothetical protein BMS3Abin16_01893 [archaeon BMS3Abin16]|nr:hypothetical protein BMS3Abin16_01893 [archaeon BMS3Abin16]